jgi:hypothetical protein
LNTFLNGGSTSLHHNVTNTVNPAKIAVLWAFDGVFVFSWPFNHGNIRAKISGVLRAM